MPPLWRERILLYGAALCIAYLLFFASAAWLRLWLVDAEGYPVAGDFVAFWSAGRLAMAGQAVEAYDPDLYRAAQIAAVGREFDGHYLWLNPPSFFLGVMPFALLPVPAGWLLWIAVTAGCLAIALRCVVPGYLVPALLAAPASVWCAAAGQNGFLTAALITGSLALLERRPWLSGLMIGLLTYKPQFGVLFPLFLLLGRHWTALAAATAATLGLAAFTVLLFGAEPWAAFLATIGHASGVLQAGGAGWEKLQSAYAILTLATGSTMAGRGAQILVMAGVVGLLLAMSRRGAPFALRAATVAAGAFLVTPYAYIYDAVVLTAAAAFLLRDGLDRGFGRLDAALIVLGCALPGGFLLLGNLAAPLGGLVLVGVAARRAFMPAPGVRVRRA
ncbi:glycosyltransferase family 87 protein [Falsiroseomonas oryziterrae]|uniref:glycosyltransferase family 87 protein n=1 Tax=Falsiroseomonas oryziterrae TaxID=2911368 RepID=UPI001F3EB7A0|nr:glycosyltransferase family 87 protein [Roseomonas sp. NPKOSM-4]